jgi:hypothetical protein
MTQRGIAPARSAWKLILPIVATIAGLGSGIVNLSIMMFSPMLFDAGQSSSLWAVFIAIWLTPLVLAAGIVVAWLGWGIRRTWLAALGLVLTVAPALTWATLVLFD